MVNLRHAIDAETREELQTTVMFWLAFAFVPALALVFVVARGVFSFFTGDEKRQLRERLSGGKTIG